MLKGGVIVTREQLEQYRSKKEEIRELEIKLQQCGNGKNMIDNSTVMDYRSGYPRPQTVIGVDWKRVENAEKRYTCRIQELQTECEEIEKFVENIEDSLTRRIFRMYYIDGQTQEQVARAVHLHRSRISKKISNFLKKAHKAQKETL